MRVHAHSLTTPLLDGFTRRKQMSLGMCGQRRSTYQCSLIKVFAVRLWNSSSRNVRKRTFWCVCLTKTQIRLRIHAVWSESSLGAFWIAKDAKFFLVDNKDSGQTARMHRLIWAFVRRACRKVRLLTLGLICYYRMCQTRAKAMIGFCGSSHELPHNFCSPPPPPIPTPYPATLESLISLDKVFLFMVVFNTQEKNMKRSF